MRLINLSLLIILFLGCSPDPRRQNDLKELFPAPLPENWIIKVTTDQRQFSPIEVLTGARAQLTLINESFIIKRELPQGRIREYHPNIILKVFPRSRLGEIEQAVKARMFSSAFPPVIFGSTDKYVYVTTPGDINNGYNPPEVKSYITELINSLKESIDIRIYQDSMSN
jgi:hypothetical protein